MTDDELWADWLARRRNASPPEGLMGRIVGQLPITSDVRPLGGGTRRAAGVNWWRSLLVACAFCVLAVRLYSVFSLVLAPVAMELEEPELRSPADEPAIVS